MKSGPLWGFLVLLSAVYMVGIIVNELKVHDPIQKGQKNAEESQYFHQVPLFDVFHEVSGREADDNAGEYSVPDYYEETLALAANFSELQDHQLTNSLPPEEDSQHDDQGFFGWLFPKELHLHLQYPHAIEGDPRDEGSCSDGVRNPRYSPSHTPESVDWTVVYDSSSCSGFFGNGYSESIATVEPRGTHSGMRCLKHRLNRGTICELVNVYTDRRRLKLRADVAGSDPHLLESIAESDERPSFQLGFLQFDSGGDAEIERSFAEAVKATNIDNYFWAKQLMNSLTPLTSTLPERVPSVRTAVLISRNEYANPCFIIMDWYHAYSAVRMAGIDPTHVDVLLLDAHPAAITIDYAWSVMFRSVEYLALVDADIIHFERALVVPPSEKAPFHESGMKNKLTRCSSNRFVADFKRFVLSSFGLPIDDDDQPRKKITFLFRQDYKAHARASGRVDRIVTNEEEVVTAIAEAFPEADVNAVHFETVLVEEQLKIVRDAAILVAVHGAGNAFSLVMPRGSVLVELFPSKFEPRKRYLGYTCWGGVGYRKISLSNKEVTVQGKFHLINLDVQKLVNDLRPIVENVIKVSIT